MSCIGFLTLVFLDLLDTPKPECPAPQKEAYDIYTRLKEEYGERVKKQVAVSFVLPSSVLHKFLSANNQAMISCDISVESKGEFFELQ